MNRLAREEIGEQCGSHVGRWAVGAIGLFVMLDALLPSAVRSGGPEALRRAVMAFAFAQAGIAVIVLDMLVGYQGERSPWWLRLAGTRGPKLVLVAVLFVGILVLLPRLIVVT